MPVIVNHIINTAHLPTDAAAQPVALVPPQVGPNVPQLTQSAGINAITTLASGTTQQCHAALTALGVQIPPGFDYQSHEWGLGYDDAANRWVIVLGGPGATVWVGNGLDTCWNFVHSHPRDAEIAALATKTLPQLQVEMFDTGKGPIDERTLMAVLKWFVKSGAHGIVGMVSGTSSLFPSNGDINSNYTTGASGNPPAAVRRNLLPRAHPPNVLWPYGPGVEIMYPHCSLITSGHENGWIAVPAANGPAVGAPLEVQYGPTTAELIPNHAGGHEEGVDLVQRFYCPVKWAAGHFAYEAVLVMNPHSPLPTAHLVTGIPDGVVTYTRSAAMAVTQNRA